MNSKGHASAKDSLARATLEVFARIENEERQSTGETKVSGLDWPPLIEPACVKSQKSNQPSLGKEKSSKLNNFADLCVDRSITPAKNALSGFYTPAEDDFADLMPIASKHNSGRDADFDILLDFLESAPQKTL